MELSLLMEYGWVLIVLIVLEGLLATDNALVLAIMVRHLPEEQRRKALFYGLAGAFVIRFGSLFLISYLVNIWQVQALGAAYLLFMSINHLVKRYAKKKSGHSEEKTKQPAKQSGFWMTVIKVEIADIAFAIDSILAAVAMAVTLPHLPSLGEIGGMHAGHFLVVFAGGFIGLVIMRFAANLFVKLLAKKPGLEVAAFCIVGWVGVKLLVLTLGHPEVAIISEAFTHSTIWKITFYAVLVGIAAAGWILSKENVETRKESPEEIKNVNV